ncbi:MAG: Trm112 family protein [Woeseia sp.]|nr:Trm112 family protein [Woeseia sp.]MBT8097318.1 Trm112 family protein [Woeseia sp.]NNE61011.1 Trm112 family protein [Woeseia sp.]NNL53613.1 Trm112 family protein [Woeseia sp.]
MDKKLLTILCCPITHRELGLAQAELLQSVNERIRAGGLNNREGRPLTGELQEALVTSDGKLLYPVADGIPVLLEGEAVGLDQLGEH